MGAEPKRAPRLARLAGSGSAAEAFDPVIHERARLGIVSALAVAPSMTFVELKEALGLTDGNLSVHARRLEEVGYVACEKGFEGRIPRTEYRLTAKGHAALARYLDRMEALIRATRSGRGR
jgi:DNA-binding MarR family transcriptional regulator